MSDANMRSKHVRSDSRGNQDDEQIKKQRTESLNVIQSLSQDILDFDSLQLKKIVPNKIKIADYSSDSSSGEGENKERSLQDRQEKLYEGALNRCAWAERQLSKIESIPGKNDNSANYYKFWENFYFFKHKVEEYKKNLEKLKILSLTDENIKRVESEHKCFFEETRSVIKEWKDKDIKAWTKSPTLYNALRRLSTIDEDVCLSDQESFTENMGTFSEEPEEMNMDPELKKTNPYASQYNTLSNTIESGLLRLLEAYQNQAKEQYVYLKVPENEVSPSETDQLALARGGEYREISDTKGKLLQTFIMDNLTAFDDYLMKLNTKDQARLLVNLVKTGERFLKGEIDFAKLQGEVSLIFPETSQDYGNLLANVIEVKKGVIETSLEVGRNFRITEFWMNKVLKMREGLFKLLDRVPESQSIKDYTDVLINKSLGEGLLTLQQSVGAIEEDLTLLLAEDSVVPADGPVPISLEDRIKALDLLKKYKQETDKITDPYAKCGQDLRNRIQAILDVLPLAKEIKPKVDELEKRLQERAEPGKEVELYKSICDSQKAILDNVRQSNRNLSPQGKIPPLMKSILKPVDKSAIIMHFVNPTLKSLFQEVDQISKNMPEDHSSVETRLNQISEFVKQAERSRQIDNDSLNKIKKTTETIKNKIKERERQKELNKVGEFDDVAFNWDEE